MRLLLVLLLTGTALSIEVNKFKTDKDFSITRYSDGSLTLRSDGMPDHATQRVNPNEAREQSYYYRIPSKPKFAKTPGCLPMGVIGFTLNGVPIFNPYTSSGQDAGKVERFDTCNGHPSPHGHYHYHILPKCVYTGKEDELLGVALDGFPIYGPLSSAVKGRKARSSDLDACHGLCVNGEYRYIITDDFPYALGCFKGELLRNRQPPGQCSYAVSCDAKKSAGTCDSGAQPSATCGAQFGSSGSGGGANRRTQRPTARPTQRPTPRPSRRQNQTQMPSTARPTQRPTQRRSQRPSERPERVSRRTPPAGHRHPPPHLRWPPHRLRPIIG